MIGSLARKRSKSMYAYTYVWSFCRHEVLTLEHLVNAQCTMAMHVLDCPMEERLHRSISMYIFIEI